jgi:Domain of unknown function (DUF5753)
MDTYYTELLPPGTERYWELEAAAASMRCFATGLIPGLLQTSEYAASACRMARPGLAAEQVRTLVHLHRRRQEQLREHGRRRWQVVLDEAALVRPVGSLQVMARQLEHLRTLSRWPGLTIQVVALSSSWPVLAPPFTVLRFADPDSPDAAAYTGITGQVILTRREAEVGAMRDAFSALAAGALSAERSARLIEALVGEAHR